MATALGLVPLTAEPHRSLLVRVRQFLFMVLATEVWGPRAIATCHAYPQSCGDDFNYQSLCQLGKANGIYTDRSESAEVYSERVLIHAATLRTKLASGPVEAEDAKPMP